MSARSSLSFGGFARKRPPLPGYLYHGSPDGDITLDERRISWEPFYATDRYEAALHFATDGHRRPGTINYVRALGPFWTLMENDVADELGPFTSYIFARRGSVRIAPLSEVYRDYLQDRVSPGERDSRLPEGRELSDYPTHGDPGHDPQRWCEVLGAGNVNTVRAPKPAGNRRAPPPQALLSVAPGGS